MGHLQQLIERYADLAVRVGVNLQRGQTLVVTAPVHAAPFVRQVVRKAYEAGAHDVHIDWKDGELTRIRYELAPEAALQEFPRWKAEGMEKLAEQGAAFLHIDSANPELLKGIKSERIAMANKAAGQALKKVRNYTMSNQVCWSVVAVPSPEWAARVFPELPEHERETALWQAILTATRCDQEDPVQAWQEHDRTLTAKAEYLNARRYRFLHYTGPGTSLTIELPANHLWLGGSDISQNGTIFMANMPTEEVFTAPLKTGVNGVVRSSRPLSHSGNLIEHFSLTFEQGRIIDFQAEQGYEALKRIIETDEGSRYLGEVALVPHQSPISQSNLTFFNTLFDENASCHLAIGNAYSICLKGGGNMDDAEMERHGLNTSLSHVDFMIGSGELDIDGERADGTREPVFRKGNWAF